MNINLTYPPMPEGAELSVIKPSAAFKRSVTGVAIAMIAFILIYILILAAAIALVFAVGAASIAIVSAVHNFWVVVLCLSLVLSTVMLFYFLIKFIFKKQHTDYSDKFEITEDDQPELFQFVRELATEAKCPFPKKIYLTADVNAAVFYDASFWNLFFPAKKNLQIGLGLVNTLNISELKAVLAHEFGHFSQRSMKLGVYVYNMHRIIYNIIYENDSYSENLRVIGNLHGIVALGVHVNFFLVRQIQKLLVNLYNMVNKSYMRLSREMEFHADAIAGYVAGPNQVISCLRKIEFAHLCYDEVFVFLNKLTNEKKRPANIYPQHLASLKFFAKAHQLPVDDLDLPIIDKKILSLNNTQINIEDQWASHPSIGDREEQLRKIALFSPNSNLSAWSVFRDPVKLQTTLTNIIYANSPERYDILTGEEVENSYADHNVQNTFDNRYKGFYNGRLIASFDVDELAKKSSPFTDFDELFNAENCNLPNRISGLQTDIGLLDAIIAGDDIKTFDHNGVKYGKHQAAEIRTVLEKELGQAESTLEMLDKQAFQFFYHHAKNPELILLQYKRVLAQQDKSNADIELYKQMADRVNPVFTTMPYDAIEVTIQQINEKEKELKPRLQQIMDDETDTSYITSEQKKQLAMYLSKDWIYFNKPEYDEPALTVLTQALSAYYEIVTERTFGEKKRLTDIQLSDLK